MRNRKERIIKTRAEWRQQSQVKKIKIMMTAILIILLFSITAGALLAWLQVNNLTKRTPAPAEVSSGSSSEEENLPIYGDSLNLMLVNAAHPLSSGYSPDLTEFQGVQVDNRIVPALEKLMDAAKSAGCPLTLSGGYVDAEKQNKLYEEEVERLISQQHLSRVRAEDQAQSTVGKGGSNETQTGLAVIFSEKSGQSASDFASTAQSHWLSENSVYYGFVLRFPENKESVTGMSFNAAHYRYVGTANAVKMREFSQCLEEYVTYLAKQSPAE